jgi:hypothetical protein
VVKRILSEPIINVKPVAQAFFPLDEQLGLPRSGFSPAFAKQMVWLSGLLPFKQSVAVMARIGERFISSSTTWRMAQEYGDQLQTVVEHEREQVSAERVRLPDAHPDPEPHKGISMDGGMVNIRGEGWRELKVGTVSNVKMRLERNPHTNELDELAHGVDVHYTAVLGTKEAFKPVLWALAVQQNVPSAQRRSVVADGAVWIWDIASDLCPDGQQVVDWYHAVEHLHKAAIALYPHKDDLNKRQRWFKKYKNQLYLGSIDTLISVLHQRDVPQFATYFERHKRRMQYLKFREQGLPIGSGTIESGVKQFKQRLTGTGMRWDPDGAQRMIIGSSGLCVVNIYSVMKSLYLGCISPFFRAFSRQNCKFSKLPREIPKSLIILRAAVLSNDFDDLWDKIA